MTRLMQFVLDWSPVLFAWLVAVALVLMVGWMFGVR